MRSVPRRTIFLPRLLVLVSFLLLALFVASTATSAPSTTCTKAQKDQRQRAVRTYQTQMQTARKAYFKTHKNAQLRAAFVKGQQAKLKTLKQAAACTVPPPPTPPAPPPTPPPPSGPVPAPPPGPNEVFDFDGVTSADQDEIKGDVAYAVQDEAVLLGAAITSVRTFASTNPAWLADQQCRFYGHDDDSCRRLKTQDFANGAAEGGTGAIFLNWASPSFRDSAGSTQKIIAHELFHTFQYQLDKLVNNGSTPFDQVRASGPRWYDEGSAELVGYLVASDRKIFPTYAKAVAGEVYYAKQITAPLDSLVTISQTQIPNVYALFLVAVDHLVFTTPAGVPALTTYLNALGAGMAWQDAFRAAFGISVEAYYANFAVYRAGL
jgi:type II secretory pathway pseudopilin PulG